ncbi:hypothetical protein, partial [Methylobacterium nigriterrae]|uniref:hypothetical protein n=1 Tax=Methylobacterium nigriterrae TaxID=3127512 RepID=UPI003014128A
MSMKAASPVRTRLSDRIFGGAGRALMLALGLIAAQGAAARTIFVTPTGVGPGYAADGSVAAEQTEAFSTETMRA